MGDGGLPEGFDIRFATADDNDQLVEVSRASAIRVGDAKVVVDPGPDYFAAFRLMDEWTAVVITHHDRVVGVQCGCSFPGASEGEPARISVMLHTRFDPAYTRMGLWSHLNSRMLAAGRERAASFERGEGRRLASDEALPTDAHDDEPPPTRLVGVAYVHSENERMRQLYSGTSVWATKPFRATIPCKPGDRAADQTPRVATPDEADEVAAILNATHQGQELFRPYTARTLRRRLEQAPDLYSWGDVFRTENAVVGVWHSPEVRIRTESDGTASRSRRALVLDHGFRPGHEDEYEALLHVAARTAADAGYDHLSVFSTDPSPTNAPLRRLADRVECYEVVVPFVDAPPDVAERGVYVDQAYF
jgi:hypothetical protein